LPASDRWNHFINFTRYIVTRTFKKSHRRIFHWSSLSFIRHLTRVKAKDEVEAAFAKRSQLITSSRQHDILLGSLLLGMRDEGQIQTLIMDQCRYPEFRSELPNLLAAFEEVVVKKEAQTLEVKKGLGVYSEATCFEFHQLLVAALSAYANTLGAFRDAQQELSLQKNASVKRDESVGRTEDKGEGRMKDGTRKVEIQNDGPGAQGATMKKGKGKMAGDQSKKQGGHGDVQKPTVAGTDHVGPKPKLVPSSKEKSPRIQELTKVRNERAQQLWECSFLLWRISYSQILRDHLNLLDAAELLPAPTELMEKPPFHPSEVGLYSGRHTSDDNESQIGRDWADDNEGDEGDKGDKGGIFESQNADGGGGNTELDGIEEINEEFTRSREICTQVPVFYQHWLRLQVNQWASLDVVCKHQVNALSHTSNPSIKISLMSMHHPTQFDQKVADWETIIYKLQTRVLASAKSPQPSTASDSPPQPCTPNHPTHAEAPQPSATSDSPPQPCTPDHPTPTEASQLSTTSDSSQTKNRTCFDAEAIIDFLKNKINEYAKQTQSHAIFHAFKPKPDALTIFDPYFYGNMHCEMVLTVVSEYIDDIEYFKNATSDEVNRLKELIKV
jgi:hypothetical protein